MDRWVCNHGVFDIYFTLFDGDFIMTVLVAHKHKDTYYIHSDGRASMGSHGIASDNYVKVHKGKDYIAAICGNCSDVIPLLAILNESQNPVELLTLGRSEKYRPLFEHFSAIVISREHGAFILERIPSKDSSIESDDSKRPGVQTMPLSDEDLPWTEGSGMIHVKAILSTYKKVTPETVKKAIRLAYKTNHTIGGKIREVSLKV